MKAQDRRLRRALFVVPYLTRFGDEGVPLSELAGLVGVKPDVLRKEITELVGFQGVPQGHDCFNLFIDGKGDQARVSAMPCRLLKRPPRLSPQEALALLIGAEAVKNTGIVPYDGAIARAAEKIRAMLRKGAEGEDKPDPGRNVDPSRVVLVPSGAEARDTLATLSEACRAGITVELDYVSLAAQRRKKIRVQPYGLLNHSGFWYVLGCNLSAGRKEIYVFRVERILAVTKLAERFEVPRDFDVQKYMGGSMFITNFKPTPITLHLTAAAAARLPELVENGRRQRDGSYRVTFKEQITGWLAAWVLRQGEGVSVVAPAELRDWVGKLARRVVEAH